MRNKRMKRRLMLFILCGCAFFGGCGGGKTEPDAAPVFQQTAENSGDTDFSKIAFAGDEAPVSRALVAK
ncbi:MAG: hypothetical protein LBU77_00085, partial [Clostridiales bacterium]|nr:hypothetical protein [Clostridiales bacterium]